jgi:two-component system KDP operon response regulator KdpE
MTSGSPTSASGPADGADPGESGATVLVCDDDASMLRALSISLAARGYQVVVARSGEEGLDQAAQHHPDLVLLDLGLPGIDGVEVIRSIRTHSSVPIIVVSARHQSVSKVEALDAGADDYVTKPFGMDELLARIRAAVRHQLQSHGERPVFRVGDLSVDLVRRIVKVGDREVKLSPKEYDLLRVLVQHAGKVLTHRFLLGELWDELTDAQYLRVYVRQLRQKIEPDPEQPRYILTETGIGYRLHAPD